ncbi:MAG TPA: choline/ethanolamine kinase family protein [Reyranellaceae bacterium]|nr:choline/ethanolamine kinase family protein [Reyranellaceae bacterium]
MSGGLSNLSFVADDAGARYVVRCGGDIPVHHVFRERERAAAIAAFEAGLSPQVVHAGPGFLVLRFIEARTYGEEDVRANIPRVAALLHSVHRDVAPRLRGPANAFWVFHVIRDYSRLIGDASHVAIADRLERLQMPLPVVFAHHDMLPANLLDDGSRLWLIDWEYGGFGTAMFDLANTASNASFGPAEDEALLAAYFGQVTDAHRRSFDAMKAASTLREALWALVSDVHLKKPDIDYQSHAREYLSRTDAALRLVDERYGR